MAYTYWDMIYVWCTLFTVRVEKSPIHCHAIAYYPINARGTQPIHNTGLPL